MKNNKMFNVKTLTVLFKKVLGLKKNKHLVENDMSVNIPFMFIEGYKKNSAPIYKEKILNIIAPELGTLIIGKAGCGKTTCFTREFIVQGTKKGFSFVNYDYMFPTLTDVAYTNFKKNQKGAYSKYANGVKFACINICDPEYSDRCNPISRESLESMNDIVEVVNTIFINTSSRQAVRHDFFLTSAKTITAAALWFLREYQNGEYCTYPHLIELIMQPDEELLPLLFPIFNTLSLPYSSTISDAFKKEEFEQLSAQTASARVPLMKCITPQMYWVMTDPDKTGVNLKVNKKEEVTVLNIANNPATQKTNAPAIGLYLSQAAKLVNAQGRVPCAFLVDEFPTTYINGLDTLIATSRGAKVCTVLIAQHWDQIELNYGKETSKGIYNIVGNFISQNPRLNASFEKSLILKNNISFDDNVPFKQGEFGGGVSDSPCKNNIGDKSFRGFFKPSKKEPEDISFPKKQTVTSQMLDENMIIIQNQIKQIVKEEMNRIKFQK